MSVINKMLRDLDKRGGLGPRSLEEGIRDVERVSQPEPEPKPWGKITAGIILVALGGGVAWYGFQSSAPSTATASKPDAPKKVAEAPSTPAPSTPAAPPSAPAPAAAQPVATQPATAPATTAMTTPPPAVTTGASAPAATPPAASKSSPAPNASPAPPPITVAKKEEPRTALPTTPDAKAEAMYQARMPKSEVARLENAAASAGKMDVAGVANAAKAPKVEDVQLAQAPAKTEPQPGSISKSAPTPLSPVPAKVAPAPVSPAPAKAAPLATDFDKVTIERSDRTGGGTARASTEYRSGNDLLARGNVEGALARYADALRSDPRHVAARQSMIVVMLDQGRSAEVQEVLRQGIAAVPTNTQWPMLLARLQVEAGDIQGGIDTLGRSQQHAQGQAEYHGFMATLQQIQGHHREAIAGYETAVRIAPDGGRWLIGLGISLEAEKRTADAREAYRRALLAGNLGRDLEAYAERKVRQLQ